MKMTYVEENGDKKLNIKASNREMKSLSEVINMIYTLIGLCDRL